MRKLTFLAALLLGLNLAACGSDDDESPPPPVGFQQPVGTVAVNFAVDDTANQVFGPGELKWKGSMLYDETTRKITFDGTWSGGTGLQWAPLYDDGPWNAVNATTGQPGHEPAGSVAGDHVWGVTVFATPPATGTQGYEFGLIDVLYETEFGNGWIWRGTNGTFNVAAGATAPIDAVATPFVLPAFGTIDMELTVDTGGLGAGTWVPPVAVKGSAWAWGEIVLLDDGALGDAVAGDGVYTFHLSEYVGAGTDRPHTGLLAVGNAPEFIFVFNGVEYKNAGGVAEMTGVDAAVSYTAGTWVPVTIAIAANNNTYFTVPAP
jgi:hypothetical protein